MLSEIIIAGSGGQGIQFAGQVLARAAVRKGWQATYVPAYGAERRGGPSFCLVVISDQPVYSPVFSQPGVLLCLDQRGRNQYGASVRADGLILADRELASEAAAGEQARVELIAASSLAELVCPGGASNLVLLAAYACLSGMVDLETLKNVVAERSGKKPELLASNLEALQAGEKWGRERKQ